MASVKETTPEIADPLRAYVKGVWTPPTAFAFAVQRAIADLPLALGPPLVIPPDEAWFWTPRWQAMEREADEAIRAGDTTVYDSNEEFLATLDEL